MHHAHMRTLGISHDPPRESFAALPGGGRRIFAISIIVVLGAAIVVAVAPFLPGLLGAAVLAVLFAPVHRSAARRVGVRGASVLVLVAALLVILLPALAIATIVIAQAPNVLSGQALEQTLARIESIHIGRIMVGAELAKATGTIASWASAQLVSLVGGVTRAAINVLIALLGLYYLIGAGNRPWVAVLRYLPFSNRTAGRLRARFRSIAEATLLDIGLTAILQGTLVAAAFALTGLTNATFWGAAAAVASVLPVVGGSLIWIPGTVVLALSGRAGAAIALGAMGVVLISNIDNVVRPIVFRRVSNIHPIVTLVGAFAGVQYFGLPGVLLGPLALAYFFELLFAFEAEYLPLAGRTTSLRSHGVRSRD
jgi:predicted PurR-regulated permease PerM